MDRAPPDSLLIARVLADDDRAAFRALIERHQPAVVSLLCRLCHGDRASADDLAQDTFLKVYENLHTFRGTARFATWVHRVAYNTFSSHAAREVGRSRIWSTVERDPSRDGGSEPMTRASLHYDLEKAMHTLHPAESTALTLSYAESFSHAEIAVVLGCPLGTVKTHILRAKEKLRDKLEDWAPRSAEAG